MALEIQHVPTLYGETAERFQRKAQEAYERRGTIDFSKQREMAERILKKAKF